MPENTIGTEEESWRFAIQSAKECGEAFAALAAVLAEQYEDAKREDPGLQAAVERGRVLDPDIGWLDVAAQRESARESAG